MDRDASTSAAVVPGGVGDPASRCAGLGAGGVPQARRLPVCQRPGGRVTEPGDVLLGREEIERAFTALGERLARRAVVAAVIRVVAADDDGQAPARSPAARPAGCRAAARSGWSGPAPVRERHLGAPVIAAEAP